MGVLSMNRGFDLVRLLALGVTVVALSGCPASFHPATAPTSLDLESVSSNWSTGTFGGPHSWTVAV